MSCYVMLCYGFYCSVIDVSQVWLQLLFGFGRRWWMQIQILYSFSRDCSLWNIPNIFGCSIILWYVKYFTRHLKVIWSKTYFISLRVEVGSVAS